MKHVISLVLIALLGSLATSALAAPPAKSTILHCGCNDLGDGLEYRAISISSKSRGHDAHAVGEAGVESCFDGVDTFTDFVRTGSDCQVDGPPLGDPIEACADQLEGDVCGAEVID